MLIQVLKGESLSCCYYLSREKVTVRSDMNVVVVIYAKIRVSSAGAAFFREKLEIFNGSFY